MGTPPAVPLGSSNPGREEGRGPENLPDLLALEGRVEGSPKDMQQVGGWGRPGKALHLSDDYY